LVQTHGIGACVIAINEDRNAEWLASPEAAEYQAEMNDAALTAFSAPTPRRCRCRGRIGYGTFRTGGLPLVLESLHMYYQYMSDTAALSISDARTQLAAIIDRARADHQPIYVARRGRRVAAVIDADDLDRIIELAEDMADIRAAEQARAEMTQTAAAPIPWDEVKADLGLT
jgi:prevent-host-death family protein